MPVKEMLEGLEDTRSVFLASHFYLDAWHNLSKKKKNLKKSPSLFLAGGGRGRGVEGDKSYDFVPMSEQHTLA